MSVSDLKETILDQGQQVSGKALTLLNAARKTNISLYDAVRNSKVYPLKEQYDHVQQDFRKYDSYVWSYLGMAARPIGTGYRDDEERATERPFHFNAHFMMSLYANHLFSQRQDIRTVLRDISDEINNLEAQANNRLMTWTAILSLIVALVSLVVSFVALRR